MLLVFCDQRLVVNEDDRPRLWYFDKMRVPPAIPRRILFAVPDQMSRYFFGPLERHPVCEQRLREIIPQTIDPSTDGWPIDGTEGDLSRNILIEMVLSPRPNNHERLHIRPPRLAGALATGWRCREPGGGATAGRTPVLPEPSPERAQVVAWWGAGRHTTEPADFGRTACPAQGSLAPLGSLAGGTERANSLKPGFPIWPWYSTARTSRRALISGAPT